MESDRFFCRLVCVRPKVFSRNPGGWRSSPKNVGEVAENLGMLDSATRAESSNLITVNILTYRGAICQYQDCRWPNYPEINDADCTATGVCAHLDTASCFLERKQKRKETSGKTSVTAFCLFALRKTAMLCLDKRRGWFFLSNNQSRNGRQPTT